MTAPDGEIWEVANPGGSFSHDLQLVNDQTGLPMSWPFSFGTNFRGASPLSPATQISFDWFDAPLS